MRVTAHLTGGRHGRNLVASSRLRRSLRGLEHGGNSAQRGRPRCDGWPPSEIQKTHQVERLLPGPVVSSGHKENARGSCAGLRSLPWEASAQQVRESHRSRQTEQRGFESGMGNQEAKLSTRDQGRAAKRRPAGRGQEWTRETNGIAGRGDSKNAWGSRPAHARRSLRSLENLYSVDPPREALGGVIPSEWPEDLRVREFPR